jgi:amidophosphoribosyltransferase
MKNIIDKDISLFLPKKYNFLLLGGNFLFSKRLYEITKRQFEIKRIDYDFSSTEEYYSCINSNVFDIYLEPAMKIKTMIDLHNSDVLIFTSEVLLFLNESKFEEFLQVIKQLKEINIKIVFISIDSPLHICKNALEELELTNMVSKPWYSYRINEIKNLLDTNKDLIYNFSSHVTYVSSNIQTNVVDLLKSNQPFNVCLKDYFCNFYLSISDNVINDLITKFNITGKLSYDNSNSKIVDLVYIKKYLLEDSLYSYVFNQSNCSVNLIYRKKSSEIERNKSVANWRYELGSSLAESVSTSIVDELDIIVPIPETGKYYAQGLSNSLNKPYVEAFYKKAEIGRSFDIANSEKRGQFLDYKLGILNDLVNNKVVGIVDEAIFTGQTLKLVKLLLDSSAVKKIYFFIASPQCNNMCCFNMMPERNLLSSKKTLDEIISYFGVEGIIFQDINKYKNTAHSAGFICTRCFE